jgi:hypothetical protein
LLEFVGQLAVTVGVHTAASSRARTF